jgi:hypothetical protein
MKKGRTAIVVGVIMLVLAGIGAAFRPDAFWITDGGNKYMVLENFLRTGSTAMASPAAGLDPENRFFPTAEFHFQRHRGEIRSIFPEYFPVAVAPLFKAFGYYGLYLPSLAGTLLVLLLAVRLGRRVRLPEPVIRIGLAALAFATPFAFYSWTFWEMTLGAVPVLAAPALLLARRRPEAAAVAAGAVLGLGLPLRAECYFAAAALGAALLLARDFRRLVRFAAGFAAAGAPVWIYQFVAFGHVLGLHGSKYHRHNAEPLSIAAAVGEKLWNYSFYLAEFRPGGPAWRPEYAVFALLLVAAAAVGLRSRRFADCGRIKTAILALSLPVSLYFAAVFWRNPEPVIGSIYTVGLFASQPFLIPVLLHLRPLWQVRSGPLRLLARFALIYIVLVPPLLTSRDLGIIWGPRHFLAVLPVLLLLAYRAARRTRRVGYLAALLAISLLIQAGGWRALAIMKRNSAELTQALERLPETIISDVYFLPMQTPRVFFSRHWLYVTTESQLSELLATLRAGGVRRFALAVSRHDAYRRLPNAALRQLLTQVRPASPPVVVALPGTSFLDVALFEFEFAD